MPKATEQTRRYPINLGILTDSRSALLSTLLIVVFAFLTALGAVIRIPLPFTPVPITLQVLFVLLAGAFLGSQKGTISQLMYVVWGAAGLPLFAGAYGLAVIAGPTGGYLVGFIPAAYLAGKLVPKAKSFTETWGGFFLASMVILLFGFLHMTLFYTHNVTTSLAMGVVPFLLGDLVKVTAATVIYSAYRKFGNR